MGLMTSRSTRYLRAISWSTRQIWATGSSSAHAATGVPRSRPVAVQGAMVTRGSRRMRRTLWELASVSTSGRPSASTNQTGVATPVPSRRKLVRLRYLPGNAGVAVPGWPCGVGRLRTVSGIVITSMLVPAMSRLGPAANGGGAVHQQVRGDRGDRDRAVVELEGEPVDHLDHAVEAADQVDGDRDQAAAFQLAGEGDDAVADVDGDRVRVHPHGPPEHLLADLVGDVGVGAEEDLEQVGAADDAEQGTGRVDHRQPLDPVAVQQPGCLANAGVGSDGDGGASHQLGRGVAGRLGSGLALAPPLEPLEQPAFRWPLRVLLLEQQVRFRDDPKHTTFPVEDRQGADPMLGDQHGNVLEGGMLVDGDNFLGHDISYAASHGSLLASSDPASVGGPPPGLSRRRVTGRAERPPEEGAGSPMRGTWAAARLGSVGTRPPSTRQRRSW